MERCHPEGVILCLNFCRITGVFLFLWKRFFIVFCLEVQFGVWIDSQIYQIVQKPKARVLFLFNTTFPTWPAKASLSQIEPNLDKLKQLFEGLGCAVREEPNLSAEVSISGSEFYDFLLTLLHCLQYSNNH